MASVGLLFFFTLMLFHTTNFNVIISYFLCNLFLPAPIILPHALTEQISKFSIHAHFLLTWYNKKGCGFFLKEIYYFTS